jgi:hypothetical protein
VKINIQIDRLVLDGFDLARNQRPLMQAAFERELGRLLVRDGLSNELSSEVRLPSLRVPSIQIDNTNNADAFGQQVAQAVHRGIGHE